MATAFAQPFVIYVAGTPQHPMRFVVCDPPLTGNAIRAAMSGEDAARFYSGESRFSLLVPVELREGVEMFDWPEIKAEPGTPASGAPQ